MEKYNGEHGYGRIGSFSITPETNPNNIVKHISEVFKTKMRNHSATNKIKFNPYTYITKDHGEIEIIKDNNGKVYGYDHGSCNAWGF
jgi:hypothetical protein